MRKETKFHQSLLDAKALLAQKVMSGLQQRGFVPFYVNTAEEALAKVLELIPEGASVGVPGSVTIREIGAIEALTERGHRIAEHFRPGMTKEEKLEARFEEAAADVFLTSSNAITVKGEMVNIDGTGNRIAAMSCSRGDKIFVVSMNKVCADIESAIARVHACAAPPNALRLKHSTPCALTGCHPEGGCIGKESLCKLTLIMHQAPNMPAGKKCFVILVGEDLGY